MRAVHSAALLLSTWFGCGRLSRGGGTAAALSSLPLAWLIRTELGFGALLVGTALVTVLGLWSTSWFLAHHDLGEDPREVVIDEVAGQWTLLLALEPSLAQYTLGFVLFRLFDIFKPWPISWVDRHVHGAWGVMADDLLAALIPLAALVALTR